ncbi:SDR family oxidoreductase [Verticiella sediminum]|uniref:SDR family oxidoreductase n=1 Tax=Verticiella sediminum TaxID=1247510 RepID=A0A556AS93_9BURK|nr:SDR family oxidoreductase [Verticiella sediminum]TSH95798.1 SDR family oxidoreductase [Verticiella sediminum]
MSDFRSFWRDRVVVITGASAGVGRACAMSLAAQGAHLCLIARDSAGLQQTRGEAAQLGASVIACPADVADAEAVQAAAQACVNTFGRIDVWINNAMATVYSPIAKLTAAEVRRVTEVTYLGVVHGTLAALRHMQRAGRGTVVQVGSALAYRGIPLQAAYSAAKHAVRGFTTALRAELLQSRSPVHVTSVHLPAIDTPQFDWARTHCPTQPRPMPPVYAPEVAARAILRAARHPRREYWVGASTPLVVFGERLAPGLLDRYMARHAARGQDSGVPVPRERPDNLHEPAATGHDTRGTWGHEARTHALVVSSGAATTAAWLVCGAALLGLGALLHRSAHRRTRRFP